MQTGQETYALRYTGNYTDMKFGWGHHAQPITFNEFMSKGESAFMWDPSFMQIPGYVQKGAEILDIEEIAREVAVQYIQDEFEHLLLGMQDYVRWAKLFKNKCQSVCPSFWAQVNMINLMYAKDLEMDDSHSITSNLGNTMRTGGQTVNTSQEGESETIGQTNSTQDTTQRQLTDSEMREATASVVNAPGQISEDVKYNWPFAADNAHETRTKQGDLDTHVEGTVDSSTNTTSKSTSTSATVMNNSSDQMTGQVENDMEYTNKQFMQERQWAIDTARGLLPLEWLRAQLRPMFYMLY